MITDLWEFNSLNVQLANTVIGLGVQILDGDTTSFIGSYLGDDATNTYQYSIFISHREAEDVTEPEHKLSHILLGGKEDSLAISSFETFKNNN